MAIAHFVYLFINWWILGCFYFLDSMNNVSMNIHQQVSVWTYVFNCLWYVSRSRIARSYSKSIFNFLRNCQTPFHSSVLLYIPTSILKGFQFLHILTHYCHCLTFIFCHPSGSSVVCHCGLGLMTNEWIWWLMTLSIFSRAFWPLVYLLGGGYSFARWKKFNRLFFCSFQFIEKLSRT